MKKITKKQAYEYARAFRDTLAEQATARPCIYYYRGKADFSPGSQVGGTASPVYEGRADIIVGIDFWRDMEEMSLTLKEKSENIHHAVSEFLSDVR